jgi:hypothetical protein
MTRITTFCTLLLILLACATQAPAAACPVPEHERTIFFEQQDIADDAPGQVAVDVTIEAITALADYRAIAVAYINKTIKGSIAGTHVGIAWAGSSCDRGFAVGARGYVVGKLVRTQYGGQELIPFSERFTDRERRRRTAQFRRFEAANRAELAHPFADLHKRLGWSEEQEKALRCDIPRSERTNYAMRSANVPDDCQAWRDGCNNFVRDGRGGMTGTISLCRHCPSIMCTHYREVPRRGDP